MRAIRACSAAPSLLPAAQLARPTPPNEDGRSDGNRRCSMASTSRKERSVAAVPTWAYHACRQCRNRQKDGSVRIPARAIRALAYHNGTDAEPSCAAQPALSNLQTRGRGPCET